MEIKALDNRKWTDLIFCILIIFIILTIYHRILYYPFIQDDFGFLEFFQKNDYRTIINNFIFFKGSFFYRHIGQLSFYLMYVIFGTNPIPYHLVLFIISSINSIIVFYIICNTFRDRLIAYGVAFLYAEALTIHSDTLSWFV